MPQIDNSPRIFPAAFGEDQASIGQVHLSIHGELELHLEPSIRILVRLDHTLAGGSVGML